MGRVPGPQRSMQMQYICGVLLIVAAAAQQSAADDDHATHDLAFDNAGRLVFTQMKAETHAKAQMKEGGLYTVEVGFDIESMKDGGGVTLKFDKANHVLRLWEGIDSGPQSVSWARYTDQINKDGWSELYVDTTQAPDISNDIRMYGAGYTEGIVTCVRLSQYHANTHRMLMKTEATRHALGAIKEVFKSQLAFMKFKAQLIPHVMAEEPEDPYFKHARYMLFQLWGLADGYNFAAKRFGTNKLALEDLLVLNSGGELAEMLLAYTPQAKADRADAQNMAASMAAATFLQKSSQKAKVSLHNMKVRQSRDSFLQAKAPNNTKEDVLDDAHWEKLVSETGHCSALVTVTDALDDIMIGHTTWADYSTMTRIFKYYTFHLAGSETMASRIGMSSYPGAITSNDNFFVLSSGLQVMDVTLEMLNPFIWDKVEDFPLKPHLPNFIHLMITNRLAVNGAHWTRLMSMQNTGTYTSQWMVVDYNKVKKGKKVPDDTFWVLEAIPGLVHAQDMSFHLRDEGYWPAFNRPYFDDIRDATGFKSAQQEHGALYSWLNNPRAKLFRTMSRKTLADMRGLMTRNLYPFTGLDIVSPGHEISARFDLSPLNPFPNGGIDAKITNRCLFKTMQVQTISSPAHAAPLAMGGLPPFQWKSDAGIDKYPTFPHEGQPNKWNFDWVQQTPFAGGGPIVDILGSGC